MNKSYRNCPASLWTFDEWVDHWVTICKTIKMPVSEIIPHYFQVFELKDSDIFTAVVDTILLETGYKIGWGWMLR
jgi:hypothetical protein